MSRDDERNKGGGLLFVLSVGFGVPLLALCGLTLAGPPSPETMVLTLATLAFVIGGLLAPWRKMGVYTVQLATLVLFAVVLYRVFAADVGTSVRGLTGPGGTEGRLVDRIVPERDVAIGGSALLLALGRMPADRPGLLDALRDGYSRMRQAEGPVPSPVVGTFVFGQHPDAHSLLRVAPPSRFEAPEGVVVFLHGFIGNVTLLCWQVAQAAVPVGLDVVCPSIGWEANWSGPEGVQTVQATLRELRAQGVRRIYLAGLSAGAIGVSRIAASLDVEGVVLISGASSRARPARVPTLVLQGALDRLTPPAPARAYARALGPRARYVEHEDAGHWMILSHHEWASGHLRRWLAEQEGVGGMADPADAD